MPKDVTKMHSQQDIQVLKDVSKMLTVNRNYKWWRTWWLQYQSNRIYKWDRTDLVAKILTHQGLDPTGLRSDERVYGLNNTSGFTHQGGRSTCKDPHIKVQDLQVCDVHLHLCVCAMYIAINVDFSFNSVYLLGWVRGRCTPLTWTWLLVLAGEPTCRHCTRAVNAVNVQGSVWKFSCAMHNLLLIIFICAILCSWADSFHLHAILHEWLGVFFLTTRLISTEVVYLQHWHGWCHLKLLPS